MSVRVAPAVFLDRDGVINRAIIRGGKPYPPATLDEVAVLPGVADALERLKRAGFALIVTTNQPDVARGITAREFVDQVHARLGGQLPIDEFRTCFHDDADRCVCRKPKPGLLLAAPEYDLPRSYMVGDRWRDIEAGRAAGCRATILVDYGYDETVPNEPDARVASLADAAGWILSHS